MPRAAAVGRQAGAPGFGLDIEVVEIDKLAGRKEVVAHVADGTLDATLLITAPNGHGPRFITIVPGELDQGGMEADGVTLPLQHRAFEVVVEKDAWTSIPSREGSDMTTQKAFQACIEEEAQEDLARVTQHNDEGHQGAASAADHEMSKMPPVDLRLLARQAA